MFARHQHQHHQITRIARTKNYLLRLDRVKQGNNRACKQTRIIRQTNAIIHENITTLIGNTPVVRINKLAPEGVEMFVKCEFFNPLSSVKDRLALAVVEQAEISGKLRPGMTVVEATSGNTGKRDF